ncbi:hypothetical protein [Ruminococcus sp.]
MSEPTPTVLRETKIGQKGFIKEDVITYLDELNSKIVALEEDNKALKEKGGQADPEEINKYKTQIENLQEKLNTSNNALRAAKKENEELQNTINQLKAQGGGQQAAAALEAAKKEIDTLKEKLKAAEQKAAAGAANPQANAQTTAALEAAKKEIEDLRNRLKAAEQKAASAGAAPAGGAADAELAKAKQEIIKISDELTAKTKEIAELTGKLEAKTKEAAEKTAEISKLNDEIVDLKENAAPTFDMGALFTEAQKNVTQIQNKAKKDAEAVTKEANDKAAQVIKDANIEAEKAVANANVAAEACIKEANEQARNTVNEANAHADKVNAMSKTVREMLLTEIESINSKFTDIASVLNNLTGQCSGRMNEAQNIIGEARKAVDTQKNDGVVKRSDPPRAEFKPSKAPRGDISELPSAKINEAKSDDAGFNKNNNNFNNNNKPAQQNNQPAAQNQQNKPAQGGNKSANFNFDMAELLKAAEEEAAKEGEN